jgi:hypothetical protein
LKLLKLFFKYLQVDKVSETLELVLPSECRRGVSLSEEFSKIDLLVSLGVQLANIVKERYSLFRGHSLLEVVS